MKLFFKLLLALSFINYAHAGELILLQYRTVEQKELMTKVLNKKFLFPQSVFKYYQLSEDESCPKSAKAILDLCENQSGKIEIKSMDEMLLKKFFFEIRSI